MNPARLIALTLLMATAATAQTVTLQMPGDTMRQQNELNLIVAENQGSPSDLVRGLEGFLTKYPGTPQRAAIEKQLAQSAVQAGDTARIVLYGGKALATPPEDLQLLDRVFRILSDRSDPDSTAQALAYSKRYQAGIAELRTRPQPHVTPGQLADQLDRAMARVYALEAHTLGSAGKFDEALATAQKSWTSYPTGEGAREVGTWLMQLGRTLDAVEFFANAFTLEDSASTAADRASDRKRMGALFAAMNGSEKGLGELLLTAYDRTRRIMRDRVDALKAGDPNAIAADITDFILPSADGAGPLALKDLKGKTAVLDFWATWCVPCRAQHPIFERVKKRYEASPEVVFISVDADEDTSLVKPFMKEQGWTDPVWFEAGLQRYLSLASIPTVLILDPAGHISSRITGMIPERFEDQLIERIEFSRKAPR